jgi:hypothetical protein
MLSEIEMTCSRLTSCREVGRSKAEKAKKHKEKFTSLGCEAGPINPIMFLRLSTAL